MRSLVCLLILVAVVAANPVTDRGKKAITRYYEESVQKLKKALEDAHPSVLVQPLKQLRELEITGKATLDYIVVFERDPEYILSTSVAFWEKKMAAVIKPYVSDPSQYKNMIISINPIPSDPDWNSTPEYLETERLINSRVQIAMQEMNQTYENEVQKMKAKVAKDATASKWAELEMKRLLRDVETSIQNHSQYAKREAANNDYAGALQKIKAAIRDRKEYFDNSVQRIYKEYFDATDN